MTAAGNAVGNAAGNVSWESLASFVQNELELKAPRGFSTGVSCRSESLVSIALSVTSGSRLA